MKSKKEKDTKERTYEQGYHTGRFAAMLPRLAESWQKSVRRSNFFSPGKPFYEGYMAGMADENAKEKGPKELLFEMTYDLKSELKGQEKKRSQSPSKIQALEAQRKSEQENATLQELGHLREKHHEKGKDTPEIEK